MTENITASFLAIDLGASSGRAMLGNIVDGVLELKEINRFKNPIIEINGRLYWNLFHLYSEIIKSFASSAEGYGFPVKSILLGAI